MKSLRRSVPSALARSIFGFALSQSLQNNSPREGCTAMPRGLISFIYLKKKKKKKKKKNIKINKNFNNVKTINVLKEYIEKEFKNVYFSVK